MRKHLFAVSHSRPCNPTVERTESANSAVPAAHRMKRSATSTVSGGHWKMDSEANPSSENDAGLGSILVLAVIFASIIGGVGSVLIVDRYPRLHIDEAFLTSWMTLFCLLSALFIVIRGARTSTPAKWRKLPTQFLLLAFLMAAGGIFLSLAELWSYLPLILLVAFGLIARLRKRKRHNPGEQPQS